MSSILEITDKEYLIKLNRSRFNLSFVRSLLKMVEVSNPSDDLPPIPDRHIAPNQNRNSEPDYFGSLDEK